MLVKAKVEAGIRAEILVGQKWVRCRVKTVRYCMHSPGNIYTVCSVRLSDGTYMKCGSNSLRVVKDPPDANP